MNELILKQIDGDKFLLDGFDKVQGRDLMKFNIFLARYKENINRTNNTISVSFGNCDVFYIANTLNAIYSFLTNLSYCVILSNEVEKLIGDLNSHKDEVVEIREKLVAIKRIDSRDNVFAAFCQFCDDNLMIKLRPYQYKAAYLLATGKGGFDFSVPGAGKTIITYSVYAYLKAKRIVDKVFVIGPINSFNAWYDEYLTCFGTNPEFENLALETMTDSGIYLKASNIHHKEITFLNGDKVRGLTKEIKNFICSNKVMLIVDEAHKIKNPNAYITKAVLEISPFALVRILLTGTPMPNGYEDLHSLMKAFSPFDQILPYNYGQLKSFTKNGASSKEEQRIRESIEPYYSRISKKYLIQTKELLPIKSYTVSTSMDANQKLLYDKLNDFYGKITDNIDEDLLTALKKALLIRKMQISANPALLKKGLSQSMDELREEYRESFNKDKSDIEALLQADNALQRELASSDIMRIVNLYSHGKLHSNKNMLAVEIVSKIVSQGKKVLLWEIFVDNMSILANLIRKKLKIDVEIINGSVAGYERQEVIDRFRSGGCMVLIANPATLAESISLHKVCQNAVYVNRNFNAAQFIQSKDRIHRINMPLGTTASYYFLMNEDTVDESIDERLTLKEQRMLAILDTDEISIGGAEFEDASIMSDEDVNSTFYK